MTMPAIDDFIMQIMAMSEALYDGAWTVGWGTYENYRPVNWPGARCLLKFYGYEPNVAGWDKMVAIHVGVDCKTVVEIRQEQGEQRAQKHWQVDGKPEYTAKPDERYLAATYGYGLAVCERAYRETGRMWLR
jgi:hypothetical protein